MSNEITAKTIEAKILTIRNQQVMIDRDLAELYGTETKVLNQVVKRNIERFPEDFMFALDKSEKDELVTNCDRFKTMKHSSVTPYAFTEQGVAMLSSVLKSPTAVEVNIQIMRAFVAMRHFLQNNAKVFSEINTIKKQLLDTNVHQKETDKKVEVLFDLIDKYNVKDTQYPTLTLNHTTKMHDRFLIYN